MSTTVLRALVVDDEGPARKQMRILLSAHPEIRVVGEAESVADAAELAARERPDVIFLDVQMPGEGGFGLLSKLDPPTPWIIFVTAHDQFAVRAFEAEALDYLLKPVHPARLRKTLERLLAKPSPPVFARPDSNGEVEGPLSLDDFVTLRDKGQMQIVKVRQIAWIEAEGTYSHLQLDGGNSICILRSIGEWERLLPADAFSRLDRSLVVNLKQIRKISVVDRNGTRIEFLNLPKALQIGRTASLKLRSLFRKVGS